MRLLSKAILITVFLFVSMIVVGQNRTPMDERLEQMELRLEQLLERIEQLESLFAQPDRAITDDPHEEFDLRDEVRNPMSEGSDPIAIRVTELSHELSGPQNNWANDLRPFLRIALDFTNNLEVETRAIRGSVVFSDFFADEWWRFDITMSDLIQPGQTATWEGMVTYNSRLPAHEQARYTPPEHIVVRLEDLEVVFVDGSRQRF